MTDYRLSGLRERLGRRGLLQEGGGPPPDLPEDPIIGAIRYDSRSVAPGDIFIARLGQHSDGHDHAAAAVAAGAVAVLLEHALPTLAAPQILVRDAQAALGHAAAWRAGDPSRQLGIVGITGTDGKTTTAYLVRAILEGAGRPAGLIGTTEVIVAGQSLGNDARTSTPEAPDLQAHLTAMRDGGDTWAVLESTSHGLAQERVAGVAYDVAVLTNITSEHLEFHGTVEAYREAKYSLFSRLAITDANPDKGAGKHAVVNGDDPQGAVAADRARAAGARVLRYGLSADNGGATTGTDVTADWLDDTPAGMRIGMSDTEGWSGSVELCLGGRFNAYNALAAMGVAKVLGLDLDAAAEALGRVAAVPGRMQRVSAGQAFSLVIDYAHTADALAKVLDELAPKRPDRGIIAVFGSAGDRDVSKRAVMGRVAGERCRLVVLTDEDPRGEDPVAILDDIARGAESTGMRRGHELLLIPDRAEAIDAAIRAARDGDVVLLAGKGHEKTIEYATGEIAWDEAAAAHAAIGRLTPR